MNKARPVFSEEDVDALKVGLSTAALALVTTGLKLGLPRAIGIANPKLVRGTFRGLIVAGAVECAYLAVTGQLTQKKAGQILGSTASSWAGAEAGALIGSLAGPVGTLAGGVVGGILGYKSFSSVFKT